MLRSVQITKGRNPAAVILILLGIIIILFVLIIAGFRIYHSLKSRINTENGIQESSYVEIGGIEQYLQIRGEDVNNPVILWLHGGPGFPLTYLDYYYQTDLEADYTVVCWEQRGCGRTRYKNESCGEPSIEQLLSDTNELVDYLRERFGQEKIIIMGQSWGTVLGINYINAHPEKVLAYIGVGQVTDFKQGKLYAAECARKMADESGNNKDVALLNSGIEKLSGTERIEDTDIKSLEQMIIASVKYLKGSGEMSGFKQIFTAVTSPEMTLKDAEWFLFASNTQNICSTQKNLMDYMYYQFDVNDFTSEYDIPICFIQGEGDWITPTDLVKDYFNGISSEQKKLVVIGNAGHTPFLDDREQFCKAVKEFLQNT